MTIKILQIIRGLDIGGESGGAELFGIKLAREFKDLPNYEVQICAFFSVDTDTERMWLETLNNEGIKTYFVSEWGGYANFNKFFKGLRNLIKQIKNDDIDVAHSHFQQGSLVAIILKWLGFTKTSFRTSHITKEWDKGKWTWILSPLFGKRIFPRYFDGEIGVSQAVCDALENRRPGKLDRRKMHLIYNGLVIKDILEQSNYAIDEKDLAYDQHDKYLIGCVGRLTDQKGYPYILQALPEIVKHIPKVLLQIVGDGELKEDLLILVDNLGIKDQVQFLGVRDDVPALMQRWDLFVLPSLREGLPTVVMEAMVCEVPVIATDIPGTNELVIDDDTGILIPVKDITSLQNAVLKMYNSPDLRIKFLSQAKKHVSQFDIGNIAKQYINLYTQEN